METKENISKILSVLIKELMTNLTITYLAKKIGLTRVGTWKIIKKLETAKLIVLSGVGSGKTSAFIVQINWNNLLIEKKMSLILTEEAIDNQRWVHDFAELENKVDFLIIYGSILHFPKQANDIDIMCISNKNRFLQIDDCIKKIQKIQLKQIHALSLTQKEFKKEFQKQNKVFIDAIQKGIVLFGQEKFIKFVKSMTKK